MVNKHIQNPSGTLKDVYGEDYWLKLAFAYLLHGSMKKAAEEAEVPYQTATRWKRECPEKWAFFEEKARTKMVGRTTGALNRILEKACAEIEKTLNEGEDRVLRDGTVVKARPPLAALNMVMGTTADKLHRIQGSAGVKRKEAPKLGLRDKAQELAAIGRGEKPSDTETLH